MPEKHNAANKGHFLRNRHPTKNEDLLKIVTDEAFYVANSMEENHKDVFDKYHKFTETQINIPLAQKAGIE